MSKYVDILKYLINEYIVKRIHQTHCYDYPSVNNGWIKYYDNPVIGQNLTYSVFDPYVYRCGNGVLHMLVSERNHHSIVILESKDGVKWHNEITAIAGIKGTWEEKVNRGCVITLDDTEYLWYTGQIGQHSAIGLARRRKGSNDRFTRVQDNPVLEPGLTHEGLSAMNPCVLWDDSRLCFRMWYAAGETYEPDVICYAESSDGYNWKKNPVPVLKKYPEHKWESAKVGGCHVVRQSDGTFIMYYIGYQNVDVARICYATSKDGIIWNRDENN